MFESWRVPVSPVPRAVAIVVGGMMLLIAACVDEASAPGESPPTEPAATATPTRVAVEEPLPTPNQSGIYTDLTIEQARELMSIDLLYPDEIPPQFRLDDLHVLSEPTYDGTLGDPISFDMFFRPVEAEGHAWVQVSQHDRRVYISGETETVTIAGVEISRLVGPDRDGRGVIGYNWHTNEASITISAVTGDEMEAGDIEALIEALLESR